VLPRARARTRCHPIYYRHPLHLHRSCLARHRYACCRARQQLLAPHSVHDDTVEPPRPCVDSNRRHAGHSPGRRAYAQNRGDAMTMMKANDGENDGAPEQQATVTVTATATEYFLADRRAHACRSLHLRTAAPVLPHRHLHRRRCAHCCYYCYHSCAARCLCRHSYSWRCGCACR